MIRVRLPPGRPPGPVLRRVPRDRRGAAAAEFALVALPIAALMLGMFDIGLLLWQRMQLQSALSAGAAYAQSFPTQADGIVSAIRGSLPAEVTDETVALPALSCDCGGADTGQAGSGCEASCPGAMRVFVTLAVSRPFAPLYLPSFGVNAARHVVRVQ